MRAEAGFPTLQGVNGLPVALLGLALAVGSGALWFRLAMAVRLPANRGAFVAVWVAALALGVVALTQGGGWATNVPAAIAILGGAFFLFTFAISKQKGGSGALQVGSPVPDFEAPDENDELFRFSSLAGQPVLLKFFRGHW